MRSAVSRYPREAFVPVFEAEVTLRFVAETRQIQKDKNARFSALCPPFLIALGISPISDFFPGRFFTDQGERSPLREATNVLTTIVPAAQIRL